ncbi:MAG: GTPase [Thermoplasmata archaeon]|nr:MAG: GTPase [Thermoplasmata archaeon]
MTPHIYIVGTAGCGKSTFTAGFKAWFTNMGVDVITVNLDPGAESLPYTPDVDIREWITLADIMDEYGLGPNGAQIAAADLIAVHINDIRDTINKIKTNAVILDTAGQIELFAFRKSSHVVLNALGTPAFIVFLFDPLIVRNPLGFVSMLLLGASVQFRFNIPFIGVLSKADLLEDDEKNKILQWSEDQDSLYSAVEEKRGDMYGHMSASLFKVLEDLGTYRRLIPVSAEELYGFEDVYNAVQQITTGGEDMSPD